MTNHGALVATVNLDWELFGRMALATVLGSVVGFERALRDKPAGFRTNILICLGACVFTLASMSVSDALVDKTRIAAQVVSGVGFLGAGAIIRDAKGVVGLTTAATIWAVAAIGMATGLGEIFLAISGTLLIMMVLVVFPALGDLIAVRRDLDEYKLQTPKSADRFDEIHRLCREANLRIVMLDCFERGRDIVFTIKALGPKKNHQVFRRAMLLDDNWKLREP